MVCEATDRVPADMSAHPEQGWKLRVSGKAVSATATRIREAHFSDVLEVFASHTSGKRVELGEIVHFMQQRSIGALLLILSLPMVIPIPAPGISVMFGIPLMLVSVQLLVGRREAWLPYRIAKRSIARGGFMAFTGRAIPTLRRVERVTRPRLTWLAHDRMMPIIGATCLVMAAIITLPIPLGHFVPGSAISLLAIGLIESDGLLIALGFLTATLGIALISWASSMLVGVIHASFPL